MNMNVTLTTAEESYIIKNLYPLYLYDLSGHYGRYPNHHGVFEDSDDYRTLMDQYEIQNIWWEKPNLLYPFLIKVDEVPAGFMLVATRPYCAEGIDYFVNEFFLLQPFRGQGIAERAAVQVFEKFQGEWELFTNPAEKNVVGQIFWRKTVSNYTQGAYTEALRDTFDGYKLTFRFNNAK